MTLLWWTSTTVRSSSWERRDVARRAADCCGSSRSGVPDLRQNDVEARIAEWDAVLARVSGSLAPEAREQTAYALVEKGDQLIELGRHDEALACLDRVLSEFSGAREPYVREQEVRALLLKAHVLVVVGRHHVAESMLDVLEARVDKASDPALEEPAIRAALLRTVSQERDGRRDQALEGVDELLARLDRRASAQLHDVHMDAMLHKANLLEASGREAEALTFVDRFLSDYGDSPSNTPDRLARALGLREILVERSGDSVAALAACDEIIARLGHATCRGLRERLAGAMARRGYHLEALHRWPEAVEAYQHVLTCFSTGESAGIDERLRWTRGQIDALEAAKRRGLKRMAVTSAAATAAAAWRRRQR